jgi:hypothetical protein
VTDLAAFADYAQGLADGDHADACPSRATRPLYQRGWEPPPCPGCVTDADRALWGRLAAEARAHLDRHAPEETLL